MMSWKSVALVGLSAVGMVACVGSERVSLEEYGADQLVLAYDASAGMERLSLELARAPSSSSCGALDESIEAYANGTALELEFAGGKQPVRGGSVCTNAVFTGAPDSLLEAGPTTLEVVDDSVRLRFVVDNAGAPRQLSLAEPGSTDMAPGGALQLRWHPETDVLSPQVVTAVLEPQEASQLGVALSASVEGAILLLSAPGDAPTGEYVLRVAHGAAARVVECTGVARCAQPVSADFSGAITVTAD